MSKKDPFNTAKDIESWSVDLNGIAMFCLSIAGYYTIKDLIKHYKDE